MLAQNDGVLIDPSETLTREPSATLQVGPLQSNIANDYGGFLVPRMTLANRGNIASPATGLLIYQTDNSPGYYYYNGTAWISLLAGSFPAGALGQTLYHNGTNWTAGSNLSNNGSTINLGQFTNNDADEWAYVTWRRDVANSWDEGLIKGSSARGAWGRTGFGIHMHSSKHFGFYSSGWDNLFDIEGGTGRTFIKGNTGIGTNNPGQRLEVNGNILLSYGADRVISTPDAANPNIVGYDLSLKAGDARFQGSASSGGDLNLTAGNANVPGSQAGGNIVLTTGRNYWNNGSNPNAFHGDIVFRGGVTGSGSAATIAEYMRLNGTTGQLRINVLGGGGNRVIQADNNGVLFASNDLPGGDASYIQNQYSGAQSANYWITGTANVESTYRLDNVDVIYNAGTDVYGNIRVLQNRSTTLQDGMYLNYNSTGGAAAHLRFFANGTTQRGYFDAGNGYLYTNRGAHISTDNATGEGLYLADDGSIVDNNDGFATHRFSAGLAITNGNNLNTHRILLESSANIHMLNADAPTIYFRDNNNRSYMTHINADRFYILHGDGNGSVNWDGNRPFTVYQGNKVGINNESPTWRLQSDGNEMSSFLARQNGTHSYGIVAGLETYNNGSATQDGPRLGFHKHGAKVWSIGIEPYGNNGFAIWEDGYNGAWGDNRKFIIPPGGGQTKVIISAAGSHYQDWPGGWGGGLSSWDMCVASIRLSGTSNRSDARLKKDIQVLENTGVSTIMALRPVSYRWIDENLPQRKIYGFVAQEVQEVLPEIIEEGSDEMKTLGMSYNDLIPILTKAVQEQQLEIESLKLVDKPAENTELNALRKEIEMLKEELNALRQKIGTE